MNDLFNLVLRNIFMKIMVINDKHIYLLHTSLQLLKVFPTNISKQLCPSHHTFGNDKIKFDRHVWINLPWNFVAFCLLLWMWACSINNKSWSSPQCFKKILRGNESFFLLIHFDPYISTQGINLGGDVGLTIGINGYIFCIVCDVWYIKLSNYWITKFKIHIWAWVVICLPHVLFSCHDTFAIYTHIAHTNCTCECAYAINNLTCYNFI